MAPAVLYEAAPPVVRITINRPEAKNAFNLDALNEFLAALERAAREPNARVLLVSGTGGDFSAGGDIQDMVARRGQAVATTERLKRGLISIVQSLIHHPLPIVARVDGDCLGAGAGIAVACDILLATQKSRFGFPFVKVGLVPDTGTSWILPHVVGVQQARRLLLTGDLISAQEAAGIGMLTQVVGDSLALEMETQAWIEKLSKLPTTALRDTKRLLWGNLQTNLETGMTQEALVQGLRFTTPEHAAAVEAFLGRRGGKA